MSDDPESGKPKAKRERPKGGRPRLPPEEKRTGKIGFSPTPEERARVLARADMAGLNVADFVRLAALGEPLRVTHRPGLDPVDRAALYRIGVNLNQIAKHLNAGRPGNAAAIEAAIAEVLAFIAERSRDS